MLRVKPAKGAESLAGRAKPAPRPVHPIKMVSIIFAGRNRPAAQRDG